MTGSSLKDRMRDHNREVRRRMRIYYAPFHGLAVFALCLVSFSILSQLLSWLGLLNTAANWLLVPFAGVGFLAAAPIPGVLPSDDLLSMALTFLVSFLAGLIVHRLRPRASTLWWALATTTLMVTLSAIAHYFWRESGQDWPDWLAYVRDLV